MNKTLNCIICNKEFRPMKYGVAKYCSSKCRKIAEKRKYINRQKKECAICGIKEKLEFHHINGNKDNNSDSNLITLCSEHHKIITKFNQKILNISKGDGRSIKGVKNV